MDADAYEGMTHYIATFWTHLAAMSTYKALREAGIEAAARPAPRALSAGCGTCVFYTAADPCAALMHPDYERVVLAAKDGYEVVMTNDQAE